ncbi:heparinase II/III domain-containing protein [Devosia sp. SL43]|uniref:heparinase II/III domain-containing protein n=1 Tax=Devosia sp. SL43 TaxID=2806348 RepID=UPI001F4336BF|nr:heparinase II/III family protein [Devosia sp. SL43]UJW87194.1 heparinase II/III family protein [Devosia sp. SL43]
MELRRWNVRHVRQVLESAPDFVPFPRGEGSGTQAIRTKVGQSAIDDLLRRARTDMLAPIPALPASLYLEFLRTGRREGYEDAQRARRNMLYRLTLAEWLERKGEFVDAIETLAFARLEETNWAWPAHARTLDLPNHPTVDLAAAMTALDLAEMDYLIGDALSLSLRARLRSEVDRRTILPFLERNDHWWLHTTPAKQVNNWTAVCIAGVVGAACYLETDLDRLANIITRGLHSLADYLETFDSQGGSSEGPDYWSYGFGNYVVLAQLLHARTGGQIDLLDGAQIRDIAQFPVRTVLTQGVWTSFSDSDSNPSFHPGLLTHLAERLDLPALTELGMRNDFNVDHFNQFVWPLRQFAWPLPERNVAFGGTAHDWFADMAWMISRLDPDDPKSLRLAVKGGHNDEMHNQNDVGSLIVVSKGKVVLTDPGRGRYSKAYFGPERYSNIFASSRGHSVPVVNGFEQTEGADHAASVLRHSHDGSQDLLELDMASAYPAEAGLSTLQRSVTLDRAGSGRVLVEDRFAFAAADGQFQSVLVTPLAVATETNAVVIGDADGGVRVDFDGATLEVSLDQHRQMEKQYQPAVDLTRVVFTPRQSSREGRLALAISPLA